MYMHDMLSRFEKQYSAIYEHDMFTVNIYFFMRISRVLCFFKHFYGLNCIKVINFSSLYQIFSLGPKQGNDSKVNFYIISKIDRCLPPSVQFFSYNMARAS
jgi:hypothetical protein